MNFYPRFAKDGTDRAMRVLSDERAAGKRAPYHVYYRSRGKLKVDAAYSETPQAAADSIKQFVHSAEIVGVLSTCCAEGLTW